MKIELSLRRQHTFRGFGPSKIEPESNKDQSRVSDTRFHHPFDDSGSISGALSASKTDQKSYQKSDHENRAGDLFFTLPSPGTPHPPNHL